MNILFMTLMYPDDMIEDAGRNSRDGMQMQINGYQAACIEGLSMNLGEGERLTRLNSLPVGAFPHRYKKLVLKGFTRGDGSRELGCVNLPYIKQKQRERGAYRAILDWAAQDDDNRTVLIYTLYLPYMRAFAAARRKYNDLRAAVIVTDLPNELGIASYRHGLLKMIERGIGDSSLRMCAGMDGFVLLTAPMAEALHLRDDQRRVVVEGLIIQGAELPAAQPRERFTVLYTGTLNRELGIAALIEAFEKLPQCDLWLCGLGDMADDAESAAARCPNISYFGFVPQQRALELQAEASALINPREPSGEYTRYSFPSKTLEYLRAGKPVLCYKLQGIPDDYDRYLQYIGGSGAEGIREAVLRLASQPRDRLQAIGEAGRAFALERKNPRAQTARIVDMLRRL